jgi:hypothetical protein
MVMALIINDRSNLTSTVAAGVGCPWLIALGAFLAGLKGEKKKRKEKRKERNPLAHLIFRR